jgi:hypothetical protein
MQAMIERDNEIASCSALLNCDFPDLKRRAALRLAQIAKIV